MMWGRSSSPQSTGQTDDEGEQNFLLHGKLKEMELPEDVLNMHLANIQKPSHQEMKKKPHDPKSQSSALEKMKKNMNMESDRVIIHYQYISMMFLQNYSFVLGKKRA